MRRGFTFWTTYHDYEAHTWQGDKMDSKVRLTIRANNYRQAVANINYWIRNQNSELNAYDFIPYRQRTHRSAR